MYLELAKEKEDKEREKNPDKFKPKVVSQMFKKDGEIRQCNEGKY
jgi:protein TilB